MRTRVQVLRVLVPLVVAALLGARTSWGLVSPPDRPGSGAPGVAALVPRATELAQRLTILQTTVPGRVDVAGLHRDLAGWREAAARLAAHWKALKASGEPRYDQLTEIRVGARDLANSLQGVGDTASAELARLAALQKEWEEEGARWDLWAEALPRGAPPEPLRPALAALRRTIRAAEELLAKASAPLLALQQEAGASQSRVQAIESEAVSLAQTLRGDLLRRTGPSLLAREFWSELPRSVEAEFRKVLSRLGWPDRDFFLSDAWVIGLQLSLFLVAWRVLRRHRAVPSAGGGLVEPRPVALALLIGFAVPYPLYGPVPSVLRLLLWSLEAPAAARVVGGLTSLPWRRRLVYGLALLSWSFQLFRVVGLPEPLLQLYVTAVAGAGVPLFLWRAGLSVRRGDDLRYTWALRLAGAMCGVVLGAQLGGFSALAAHVLDASVRTVFVVLLARAAAGLVRGAIEGALTARLLRRLPLLRESAVLARRLALLAGVGIGGLAVSILLDVWRVYPSPTDAVKSLFSLGVTVGGRSITLGVVLAAGAVLYGAFVASWTVQALLGENAPLVSQLDSGVRMSIRRIIHYTFVLVGFVLALGTVGVELRNLAILASALGIGVGFGLQNIVNNFVSGLILLFERPVKVGDVVQVGGEWGQIKQLGLRSTVIQTFEQSEIIVPNSHLVSNPVTNWTLSDRQSRVVVPVGVAYGTEVDRVLRLLADVAEKHPAVLRDPGPQALFLGFGGSSLDFELRVWVGDVVERPMVKSELLQALDREFRAAGVEIPFPQRAFHLKTVDPAAAAALRGEGTTPSAPRAEEQT